MSRDQSKIVIMGPGRSGTSFLIRVLAGLGVDAGGKEREFNPGLRAGCEWSLERMGKERAWWRLAPKLIKGPYLSFMLDKCIEGGMRVEHAFIPVRDPSGIARSRVDTGLQWGGDSKKKNKEKAEQAIGASLAACLKHCVPYTILKFPDYLKNPDILLEAFKEIPTLENVTKEELENVFWPLTREHEALANVDQVRRRDLSNKGKAEADPERPEDVGSPGLQS